MPAKNTKKNTNDLPEVVESTKKSKQSKTVEVVSKTEEIVKEVDTKKPKKSKTVEKVEEVKEEATTKQPKKSKKVESEPVTEVVKSKKETKSNKLEPLVETTNEPVKDKSKKAKPVAKTTSVPSKVVSKKKQESDSESDSEDEDENDDSDNENDTKDTQDAKDAKDAKDTKDTDNTDETNKMNQLFIKTKKAFVSNNVDENLEKLLDEKKKEWADITARIHTLNQDRENLELLQKNLVKELTELMNKLQKDEVNNGFILEKKSQDNLTKTKPNKKEIIAMDADSDTSDSDSDSESEDEVVKPKLNCKKDTKLVKTTKNLGKSSAKSLKKKPALANDESSDSDSD